ncbi:MAG: NADH-quinone oxidoreductase subunit J [Bacteroidia bacterium]|nr:NADH-quinone oxidoreductase subunit J [Bacteroidia bacterium]
MTVALACVAALLVAAAVGVLRTRNLIYLAFGLFAILLAVAGSFALAGADFLAVTHVLVYVGGILVLLVFGILLSRSRELGVPSTRIRGGALALVSGLALAGGLAWVFNPLGVEPQLPTHAATAAPLGRQLLSTYLGAFEALSFLLLLALIGAAYLVRKPTPQR